MRCLFLSVCCHLEKLYGRTDAPLTLLLWLPWLLYRDSTKRYTFEKTKFYLSINTEIGWFATVQLPQPLLPKHRERLLDAAANSLEAVVKAQTTSTEEDQGGSFGSQMACPADG